LHSITFCHVEQAVWINQILILFDFEILIIIITYLKHQWIIRKMIIIRQLCV